MSGRAQERADLTSNQVLALYAAYRAGRTDLPDFVRTAAMAIFAGKVIASRLADIAVSVLANRPPIGIAPGEQHVERLSEALSAILTPSGAEMDLDPTERLERLALAETLNSHRKTLHAAIKEQGFPEWVRVVEEDACEVCAPLAGEVQPISVGFRDHPGCRCTLEPHGELKSVKTEFEESREEPLIQIGRGVRRVG